MSAQDTEHRLGRDVAKACAAAARIDVAVLDRAVDAALHPGGPDAYHQRWYGQARCHGTNMHPELGEDTEPMFARCHGCPVQAECLGAALYRGEKHGIWGGTSEKKRRVLSAALRDAGVMVVVGRRRIWRANATRAMRDDAA